MNPKVHYRIHNSLPPVPKANNVNPAHNLPPRSLNINFNITFPYRVPTTIRAPYRTHLIFPDPFTLIVFGA